MKKLFIFLFFIFSTNTFSNCTDDFNNGLNEYNFATKYFQSGTVSYNKAVKLSDTNNPNFLEICNLLVDSITGFNVAKDSYSNCYISFSHAATSCSEEDSIQSKLNRDV